MPAYIVDLDAKGPIRLTDDCISNSYHFTRAEGGGTGFRFSINVSAANSNAEAEGKARAEAKLLLDCLSFTTKASLELSVLGSTSVPTEGEPVHRAAHLITNSLLAAGGTPAQMQTGVDMRNRLREHERKNSLATSLHWYCRGLSESDLTDRFVDYWVAMEVLANSYPATVDAQICRNCGVELRSRPYSGLLREYLREIGMRTESTRVDDYEQKRGDLFHSGRTEGALEVLQEIEQVLRTCFQREIYG